MAVKEVLPVLMVRIALLSIHAASTLALFLIETWQRRKTRSTR